jgi:transposase
LLDENTIRSTYKLYLEKGIQSILSFNYVAGISYLSVSETEELNKHLENNMYTNTKAICNYIEKKYGVIYTTQGVHRLLKRLNFVYKKTKHLPGKGDLEKQKAFEVQYHSLKANKRKVDEIYFMDGVHPLHNSILCNGWIKKGTEKAIKSNTGRDRLNINGACNVAKGEVIIHTDLSVNAQSTICLFDKMQAHQSKGILYVIADNAKYYRSKLVATYLEKNKRLKLIFLPPYSPNLNLIERLWRFYKKEILYDNYYETFEKFKQKTLLFFKNIKNYKNELSTLLKDNFYYPLERYSKT